MHVQESIPLAHLSHVAVEMREADYIALSALEEKLGSKGMFQVGWYHSHPDIKLMLSLEDVKTQAGLQKPNPSSIALVFNHVHLMDGEGDTGFKVFRLDDPSTIEIKYHEVMFEIAGSDASLLAQARIMLANVQKQFTGTSAAEGIIGRVEKTIKEMLTEVTGLKEHLATIARQGNPSVVEEARAKHVRRIEASFEKKASTTRMQLEFLDFLELVERQRLSERVALAKEQWASFERSFKDLLK